MRRSTIAAQSRGAVKVFFRRLARAGLGLVFCDAGYHVHVPLRQDTSEAGLRDLLDAAG
ncbi:hypothetical protein [Streptomyces lavendulocolor]|uniref:hypothetical protein n=1 Tax=Streptomyces lavendulocolor TaxID=67316 RepID=UPI003C2CC800